MCAYTDMVLQDVLQVFHCLEVEQLELDHQVLAIFFPFGPALCIVNRSVFIVEPLQTALS